MVNRTYSKVLEVLGNEKLTCKQIIEKFPKVFGYEPLRKTIHCDLCRATKEGILTRDVNGFYSKVNK